MGTVASASEVGNESSSPVTRRPKWRGPGNQNMPRRPWKENDPIKLFINSCAYSPTQAVHVEARKLNSTIDNYPVTRQTNILACRIDQIVKETDIESQPTEGWLELATWTQLHWLLTQTKISIFTIGSDGDKESH